MGSITQTPNAPAPSKPDVANGHVVGESPHHIRAYDSLPDPRRVWAGSPGSREEGLGRLVLLTPEVVAAAAASSIRSGRRVALNWDLTKLDVANFGRNPAQHHIVPIMGGAAHDDVYIFNPQQSSQWDGLRHFSAPDPGGAGREDGGGGGGGGGGGSGGGGGRLFYGGTTSREIQDRSSTRIGLQHWAAEGIVGRGVLLDYKAYADRRGWRYSTFSDHAAGLATLLDVAREQGTTFRRGDILFVRIGVIGEWDGDMTPADRTAYARDPSPRHAGVEGTEEMLRWIWDEGFAAVAGDAISFEVYPPQKEYARDHGAAAPVPGLFMHEYLLAGWGMPVGELFDLEGLSRLCKEENRWEFFVSSAPLNMPGGVSSPPNCIAIF